MRRVKCDECAKATKRTAVHRRGSPGDKLRRLAAEKRLGIAHKRGAQMGED